MIKSVLCVIGHAEDEIADKPAERQKDDPQRPFAPLDIHHAVHDQQQPDAGVGQRRGERRGINQAGKCPALEELAFQVQHQPRHPDDDRSPTDRKSQ